MSEAKGEECNRSSSKPLKVLVFNEARYCPKGFRPPWVVRRAYEWTYL